MTTFLTYESIMRDTWKILNYPYVKVVLRLLGLEIFVYDEVTSSFGCSRSGLTWSMLEGKDVRPLYDNLSRRPPFIGKDYYKNIFAYVCMRYLYPNRKISVRMRGGNVEIGDGEIMYRSPIYSKINRTICTVEDLFNIPTSMSENEAIRHVNLPLTFEKIVKYLNGDEERARSLVTPGEILSLGREYYDDDRTFAIYNALLYRTIRAIDKIWKSLPPSGCEIPLSSPIIRSIPKFRTDMSFTFT